MKTRNSFFIFLLFGLLSFGLLIASQAHAAQIQTITFNSDEAGTRVLFELSQPVEYSSGMLENPDRFYIDLKKTAFGELKKEYDCGDPVQKIRLAQYDKNTIRVVFDLSRKSTVQVLKLDSPPRLMVIFRTPPGEKTIIVSDKSSLDDQSGMIGNRASETAPAVPQNGPAVPQNGEVKKNPNSIQEHHKRRVVIDAGHGGHDPGAIGRRGLKEKNITLAIALEVAKRLRKLPDFEVYLTRDSDMYLTLDERAKKANALKADLFLSVHVNASPHRSTKGIETYFLNFTDDEEANRVAARENDISMERMKEARNELGMILASLELQGKRDESLKLAHLVQNSMVASVDSGYRRPLDLGVKQALFYVLVGAEMPSVLAEVSFISNGEEEKLLRDRHYLEQIASGISKGIENYLKEAPSQNVAKK